MATATMATAVGAVALLYYTLNRKLQLHTENGDEDENTISTLSDTLRFTYSETLGKRPIGDLAFGINFLLKRQGNFHVESEFGGKDSLQPKGPEIVGHSLGGGTAALLTYILRERKELFETTCVTFAPAACMTWELAGSGNGFITSVINGGDLVPTFSAASVDDLRAELTASAWINDLRSQIEQTRILSTVYRSASALGSRIPSIATAKAKVTGAGAILRPVSNGTRLLFIPKRVVMRRARSMAHAAWTHPPINSSSWLCMGPRRRLLAVHLNSKVSGSSPRSGDAESSDPLLSPKKGMNVTAVQNVDLPISSSVGGWSSEIECSCADRMSPRSKGNADLNDSDDIMELETHEDKMTEVELWQQLEHEQYDSNEGEEADVIKEMREEEAAMAETTSGQTQSSALEMEEVHRFFPAGKIMHIVTLHPDDARRESDGSSSSMNSDDSQPDETKIGIFITPRSLYSKLRLSQTMISDHFMPVYRRQIERLIEELQEEESNEEDQTLER